MSDRTRYLPVIVTIITVASGTFFEARGMRIGGPFMPGESALLRELVGPIMSILFPWNGWVFLVPMIIAFFVGWKWKGSAALWAATSFAMGVADTVVSFDDPTIARCIKGVAFYMVIFGATWAFFQLCVFLIGRVSKCRQ